MPMLDVDTIDILSGIREDTEEDRNQLDISVRNLGLLQPIVVAENPEVPGRYAVLAGRRRLLSHKRLGVGKIHATVIEATEVQRELVEVTENLIRLDLAPLERARSTKRYVDLWSAQHPEVGEAMRARRRANLKAGDVQADAEARGAPPAEVAGAPKTAVEAVAKATGKSVRTVQAAYARAEKSSVFTDDEAAVLNASRLSERRVDRIAAIEDPQQRRQVINLVAANMAFPAAMRDVLGEEYEGDREEDEELSDEEFLSSCPIRGRVNRAKFDADALLWRKLSEPRRALARSIGWGNIKAAVGLKGPYFRRLLRVLDAPAPTDWLQCHSCAQGITKVNGTIGECMKCGGGGYIIQ